ncbi:MAG: D-alanyl-D-alanine carboxypeptidase, partial [Alphaproteobacteria bacterium]
MQVTLQNLIRYLGAGILGATLYALPAPAAPIETPAPYALLMDMRTGAVLFEKSADQPMQPASMSKIMTAFMVFERLK